MGDQAGDKSSGDPSEQKNSSKVSSEQIYRRIFDAIVDHKLRPGTHLKEDELCDLFGVGRTRIRTALSKLASNHVIELVENRGAFVSRPSVEEAREVFRARRVIEGHLIRRAAERRDDTMKNALTGHLHTEQEARLVGDTGTLIRRCGRYHQVLADQAESPIMANFLRELIARSSLIIAIYESDTPRECGVDEHQLLSQLILEGQADEAAQLMEKHLYGIEEHLELETIPEQISELSQILN